MADDQKRYVYEVELDIKGVSAQVEKLRKLLAETFDTSSESAKAAEPVKAMADELRSIAKLDLSQSTDELQKELQNAEKDAARLNDQLERMAVKGGGAGAQGASGRAGALFDDVIDKIRRELGEEAANISAYTGALPPGARGGEFLSGTAADLGGADAASYFSETQGGFAEVASKRRQSAEETQQEQALTVELYETQIKGSQAQQELLRRENEELDGLISSLKATEAGPMNSTDEIADDINNLDQEYRLNADALASMMEEESDLARSLADAKERQAKELQKAQQTAARTEAKRTGSIAQAGGTATAYTQQTAITVTKAAVSNAKELTAALEQAAEASERLATNNNRGIDSQRRSDELDQIRERLKLETEAAKVAAEAASDISEAQAKAAESAKQTTNARKAQEDRVTVNAREESQKRIDASRTENRIEVEAAKQTTKRLAEEERRRTAQTISETKKAAQARQTASGQSLGTLGRGALAAVGVYSVDQVARQFYQEGATGAQQLRAAQTFDFLAERANVSADEILEAVDRASSGTIDDMTAMTLSAQLLAQRFAATSTDIVGDTETLVSASRRFSQIYVDEGGAFLSTAEVYSRLIKFIREGNKELVDQFGLSNQAIASFLDVPVDGLASAEGAALRMRGVVGILEQEVQRLGASENTLADQIESSEARILDSRNRIRQALAEPAANVAEFGADAIEGVQVALGRGDIDLVISQVERLQETTGDWFQTLFRGQGYVDRQKEALGELADALKLSREAQRNNVKGADEYTSQLEELGRLIVAQGSIHALQITELDQVTDALGRATYAAYGYSGALGGIEATGASAPTYNPLRDKFAGVDPVDSWVDTIQTQAERDDNYYALQVQRLDEQRALDERNAQKAQQEWEAAARQAESEWKAAAAEIEAEFKSIAGLFDTTDVTAEDLAKAEAGIYEEKPDEYLRQLRDEVVNGKDYEGVSIEDAARRLGADASLSADAILLLFEEAWADSSLFAGGENLDLINREAVERELGRIEESKLGQQAILDYFGITTAQTGTAAVASAAGATVAGELGQGKTMAEAVTGELAEGFNDEETSAKAIEAGKNLRSSVALGFMDPETMPDFGTSLAVAVGSQMSREDVSERAQAVGANFIGLVHAGWVSGAEDYDWVGPIASAAYDQATADQTAATAAAFT